MSRIEIKQSNEFKHFEGLPLELQNKIVVPSDTKTLRSLARVNKALNAEAGLASRIANVATEAWEDCIFILKAISAKSTFGEKILPEAKVPDEPKSVKAVYQLVIKDFNAIQEKKRERFHLRFANAGPETSEEDKKKREPEITKCTDAINIRLENLPKIEDVVRLISKLNEEPITKKLKSATKDSPKTETTDDSKFIELSEDQEDSDEKKATQADADGSEFSSSEEKISITNITDDDSSPTTKKLKPESKDCSKTETMHEYKFIELSEDQKATAEQDDSQDDTLWNETSSLWHDVLMTIGTLRMWLLRQESCSPALCDSVTDPVLTHPSCPDDEHDRIDAVLCQSKAIPLLCEAGNFGQTNMAFMTLVMNHYTSSYLAMLKYRDYLDMLFKYSIATFAGNEVANGGEKSKVNVRNLLPYLSEAASSHLSYILRNAAEKGDIEVVSYLFNKYGRNFDIDECLNSFGFQSSSLSALILAAHFGHIEVAELLLKNGANPFTKGVMRNEESSLEITAIEAARNQGHTKIVSLLESYQDSWRLKESSAVLTSPGNPGLMHVRAEVKESLPSETPNTSASPSV